MWRTIKELEVKITELQTKYEEVLKDKYYYKAWMKRTQEVRDSNSV